MPPAASVSSVAASCSGVEPMQERCAIAVRETSCWIWTTSSTVLRRVEPPAPQVTDTKSGSSGFRSRIVSKSAPKPASVLGGKNSKEKTGRPVAKRSAIRISGVYHDGPSRLTAGAAAARLRLSGRARDHPRVGLARPRPHHGLPGSLQGPHPPREAARPQRLVQHREPAHALRRRRGEHRLPPAPARRGAVDRRHRRQRLRPLRRVARSARDPPRRDPRDPAPAHGAGLRPPPPPPPPTP